MSSAMIEGFRKGDADVAINGEARTLRLTLGALAELEERLGEGDFAKLQSRLEAPRIADLLIILQALLRGGGFLISLDALKASDVDLAAAARAIAAAFISLAVHNDEKQPLCSPVYGGAVARSATEGGISSNNASNAPSGRFATTSPASGGGGKGEQ